MNRSRAARLLSSLSVRVVIALILGLCVGAAVQTWGGQGGASGVETVEALGGVWLNALRITVIPLIFALLVNGVASIADAAQTGRLAMRAMVVFAILIVAATVYAIAAGVGLLALWPIDAEGGRALLSSLQPDAAAAVGEAVQTDGFRAFLNSLAPSNLVKAAADDGVLGVVLFALIFGFAVTRLEDRLRTPVATFFEAVAEAMIVMVHWILMAAPFGVFALALGVGLRAGLGAVGVLSHYIGFVSLSQVGLILLTYAVAVIFGRISLARFAQAVAPAQAVAFSTQSSLASLPAMVEQARVGLGASRAVAGLVLPLAVAVFRITSPVANLAVCLYVAQLYGIPLEPGMLIAGGLTAIAASVAAVGLPGQVSFFLSIGPICLAMGLPLAALPLLLAVEVIPDIFRTVGNVTADLAATRIVQVQEGEELEAAGEAV